MPTSLEPFQTQEEIAALQKFKIANPFFFKKNDFLLTAHLLVTTGFLGLSTLLCLRASYLPFKILAGAVSAFFWFCLINITIHHHLTHGNAAQSAFMKKIMDALYRIAVFNAPKRRTRYTRAHLNHHRRPYHETDVDHHYGAKRYLEMSQNVWDKVKFFLELTFVGAHMPGWEDDHYMNHVPLETWNQQDYLEVKKQEADKAWKLAILQWGGFFFLLAAIPVTGSLRPWLEILAWGWAFPMLLVKNWAHFLGQFQHYNQEFLKPDLSINRKTQSYHVPSLINYFSGGELSGHFLHHLYPEMPYYHVESARKKFISDPELARLFLIY